MHKQTWKCCTHSENEYFLTTDRLTSILDVTSSRDLVNDYYYDYVFILSAISPYTTGLKALFNQSDCTGTAPTDK